MKFYSHVRSALLLAMVGACPFVFPLAQNTNQSSVNKSIPLRQGWEIQSGCKIQTDGAQLSSVHYRPEGWIHATVATTVLAAQVAAGIYKDPYYE